MEEDKKLITQVEETIIERIKGIQPDRAQWQPLDSETAYNIPFQEVNNKEHCLCGRRLKFAYPHTYNKYIIYLGEVCSREHFNKYRCDGRHNVKLTYMKSRPCKHCGRTINAGFHSLKDSHYKCDVKFKKEFILGQIQTMSDDNPNKEHLKSFIEKCEKAFENNNKYEGVQLMNATTNMTGFITTNADISHNLSLEYEKHIKDLIEYAKAKEKEEADARAEAKTKEKEEADARAAAASIARQIEIERKKKERENRLDAIYTSYNTTIKEREYSLIGQFKYYDTDKKRYVFYVYDGIHTPSTNTAKKISNYIKQNSVQYFSPVWYNNDFNCYRVILEGDREKIEQDKHYILAFTMRQRTGVHGMKFIYTKKEAPALKIEDL